MIVVAIDVSASVNVRWLNVVYGFGCVAFACPRAIFLCDVFLVSKHVGLGFVRLLNAL